MIAGQLKGHGRRFICISHSILYDIHPTKNDHECVIENYMLLLLFCLMRTFSFRFL